MPDMSSSTTPPIEHKSNANFILLLPLMFFLGLGAGYLLFARRPADTVQQAMAVSAGNSPSIGPKNAPVTIIEFGDYQCPYCKLWHDEVFDQLMANYPGKIRFVYRDFPLQGHPEALPAAEAADCAGEQNAYWNYHDALFGQQYGLGHDAYVQYATDLKLNVNAFTTCIDSHRNLAEVKDNLNYAIRMGVQSTPSFYINGIPLIGAQPYETFQQAIEQALAGSNQ